ncbi:S-adenosyl-L-methionine-dependent methyltransferase [Aspergillus karnatakaensis]|uniref:class I SAM-dependent methyltransferase n=1 Tax=Aspergillus karnatakaensis TaxID=1810916 RepID=UPI003CCD12B3
MASQSDQQKDHWSSEAYSTSASFVPRLTQTLLQYLDPQPTDKVLDIGCGDGKFTAQFIPHVQSVLGIDASPAMIEAANRDFESEKAAFRVVDCCHLEQEIGVADGRWDKVVSNAALHWILRDETTRLSTLRGVHACLKQGGTFVFEMGGHGNVGEVNTALMYSLLRHGVPIEKIREVYPWFFPSIPWMTSALEGIGFKVIKIEMEHRPTLLTSTVNGGLAGWVRLMGASFLEALAPEQREEAVKEVCDVLQNVVTRKEDGSQWLQYVRLRGVAEKL